MGDRKIDYDFVLSIEDSTGVIPRAFNQLATQFEIMSKEIKQVRFPEGLPDGEESSPSVAESI